MPPNEALVPTVHLLPRFTRHGALQHTAKLLGSITEMVNDDARDLKPPRDVEAAGAWTACLMAECFFSAEVRPGWTT